MQLLRLSGMNMTACTARNHPATLTAALAPWLAWARTGRPLARKAGVERRGGGAGPPPAPPTTTTATRPTPNRSRSTAAFRTFTHIIKHTCLPCLLRRRKKVSVRTAGRGGVTLTSPSSPATQRRTRKRATQIGWRAFCGRSGCSLGRHCRAESCCCCRRRASVSHARL